MPLTGARYQQKKTYKLNTGEISKDAPVSLTHKIKPFERIVTVREATNEEFAEFIWQMLPQLYTKEKRMMNAFDDLFDLDWTSPVNRAGALINLVNINKSREKSKRIRLFVGE